MAALSQCRALAGAKAFTGVRPSRSPVVANGSKYFMKKKDSYMVEVEVAEDEPEDMAVRKFMKQVMQSRVVEQLRARRTKETKIEEYKRRFRERCEARKLGIVEPTWEELYPNELDPRVFDEYFQGRDPDDPDSDAGAMDDLFGTFGGYDASADKWGSYVQPANGGAYADGYGTQAGFMQPPQQSGWNQGAYIQGP